MFTRSALPNLPVHSSAANLPASKAWRGRLRNIHCDPTTTSIQTPRPPGPGGCQLINHPDPMASEYFMSDTGNNISVGHPGVPKVSAQATLSLECGGISASILKAPSLSVTQLECRTFLLRASSANSRSEVSCVLCPSENGVRTNDTSPLG